MTDEEEVVYVVDDDLAVRKGLARLLRSAGLSVATYASAAEFLAQDRHQGVGCIVLDVRMPGVWTAWRCRHGWRLRAAICPSSSSPATAIFP